eukprot:411797-Pelagomonas_calceolata.AAC.1
MLRANPTPSSCASNCAAISAASFASPLGGRSPALIPAKEPLLLPEADSIPPPTVGYPAEPLPMTVLCANCTGWVAELRALLPTRKADVELKFPGTSESWASPVLPAQLYAVATGGVAVGPESCSPSSVPL